MFNGIGWGDVYNVQIALRSWSLQPDLVDIKPFQEYRSLERFFFFICWVYV